MYQEEVEGLSILAQQVLEETHVSSRVSTRAAQLTSRYHALVLHLAVSERLKAPSDVKTYIFFSLF